MPRFTVYQVQDICETRRYSFEVEAATASEAIELVRSGDGGEPEDLGTYANTEYGDTGECAFAADQVEPADAWEQAVSELDQRRDESCAI